MDLPTLTINDTQAQVLLQVFGNAASYRQWLKSALREEVERRIARTAQETANATVRAAVDKIKIDIPDLNA